MTVHPMQASPEMAASAFAFLSTLGFTLEERWISAGDSYRDGWRLFYTSPRVRVVVQYLDAQFEVHFSRGAITTSYLGVDRGIFLRRSGFHGDMFPAQKLENAVGRIAKDISENYALILAGDESAWARIAQLDKLGFGSPHLP